MNRIYFPISEENARTAKITNEIIKTGRKV